MKPSVRATGVTVFEGGYRLEAVADDRTEVTIFNEFEAYGIGKLLVGFAAKTAKKDAPAFAARIGAVVEAS